MLGMFCGIRGAGLWLGDKNMIIDLCSGYGGATQSFNDEEVVKIDIDPKVKPNIVASVEYLPLRKNLKPRLLWASPPCTFFSIARQSKSFNPSMVAKSLRLVSFIYDAIDWLKPETWIIENPRGRLRYFLGLPDAAIEYSNDEYKHKKVDLWSNSRGLRRAFIPSHISKRLKDFIDGSPAALRTAP
jgi:hypothetical protein